MKERAAAVDARARPPLPPESDAARDAPQAMRYSVFAGGKRLRPVLVIAGAEAVGGRMDQVDAHRVRARADPHVLPRPRRPSRMDNDDFRRGVPTNHKVFGEAMAILAGDALLTLAFRLVADYVSRPDADPARLRDVLTDIADAAGTRDGRRAGRRSAVRGQARRSRRARRTSTRARRAPSFARRCAWALPLRRRAQPRSQRSDAAGAALGLAFQIVDDILDVVSSSDELGKTAGKDESAAESHLSRDSRDRRFARKARVLIDEAEAALDVLGPRAEPIRALGRFILERRA